MCRYCIVVLTFLAIEIEISPIGPANLKAGTLQVDPRVFSGDPGDPQEAWTTPDWRRTQ